VDHSQYLRVARALRIEADSARRLARKLASTTIEHSWWGLTRHTAQASLDDAVGSVARAVSQVERAEKEALRRWREELARSVQGGYA
jgi:hypothetical protein